jgi:MEMO1 family protein
LDEDKQRLPAVAGMFYPLDKEDLFESIHRCFTHPLGPGRFPQARESDNIETKHVECLIVPHAGYEYSGPVAAHSYRIVHSFFQSASSEKGVTVIILGPNHYGIGSGVALSPCESWITPLGKVRVNKEFSKKLLQDCDILDSDELAHSREHSIEVQLPFLQVMSNKKANWSFVPISMMLQDIDTAKQIADALFKLISKSDENVLVVGSSDLTHYEPQEQATKKDLKLLEALTKIDVSLFYGVLERLSVTSCGYGAIATVAQLSKKLGKTNGTVLKYSTSGDVTGDLSAVVGYPSVHFV